MTKVVLSWKKIKFDYWIYWFDTEQGDYISLATFENFVELNDIRTRSKARDKIALFDLLRIFQKDNLLKYFKTYSPKELNQNMNDLIKRLNERK